MRTSRHRRVRNNLCSSCERGAVKHVVSYAPMRRCQIVVEPIRHFERPGKRVLDLRPFGVPFLPTLSVSHMKVVEKVPQSLHVHRGCVEIVYCVRGSMCFETPDRDYPFLPGTIFVSRADEPHRLSTNPKGHFVYRVLVSLPDKAGCFLGLTRDESKELSISLKNLPRCFPASDAAVCQTFRRMFEIFDRKGLSRPRRSFELRTAAYELLRQVLAASESVVPRKPDAHLARIVSEIREYPERNFDFDALRGNRTPGAFAREFTKVAGQPPLAFWNSCKVNKARDLLRRKELSVTDVSTLLHFCSTQHFATVFKKETGCTPTEWKKGGEA